jgi:hypothetical protein
MVPKFPEIARRVANILKETPTGNSLQKSRNN